jgi:hypothetical protein
MTADQQAADAFDREWQHAVAGLPARPCLSDHAAVLKHRRCELSIQELLQYYSRKLPAYLYGPLLLSAGAQLQARHDFRLAAELCFKRLADLNLPGTAGGSCRKLDAAGRLSLHVQALYGLHACQAAEAMLQDSHLQHQHTITAVMSALAGLQEACQMAVPAQPMLVHAGTQHIHKAATQLLAAGLHAQVLPHLLFAARAMECHISLSSTHLLPWRVQLYAAATECFFALSSCNLASPEAASSTGAQGQVSSSTAVAATADGAMEVLAAGLSQLASITRAQALDAVPAPDVMAAVQAAQAQLTLLQALFEQRATAAANAETPAAAGQVLASVKAVGRQQEQLAVLLRLLQIGLTAHSSPLQKAQLPANLQPAMSAAAELAVSVLGLAGPDAGPQTATLTRQHLTACSKLHQVRMLCTEVHSHTTNEMTALGLVAGSNSRCVHGCILQESCSSDQYCRAGKPFADQAICLAFACRICCVWPTGISSRSCYRSCWQQLLPVSCNHRTLTHQAAAWLITAAVC